MSIYTSFPTEFPAFALVDALGCIKDGAAATPAGKLQLAHSGWELAGWALHAMTEGGGSKPAFFGENPTPLTDDEALTLLAMDGNIPPGLMSMTCPITPAVALKLAGWLLKAAEIVIPILL